jgi:hypothetical protein
VQKCRGRKSDQQQLTLTPEKSQMAFLFTAQRNNTVHLVMVMSQERSDMLAHSDLDGRTFRVLHKLIAILDMDNLIAINQSEIAASMGLDKSNFSRAIKKLLTEKILIEGAKLGQHKSYRLNAYYGWKGSTENHNAALESDPIPLSDRMKQSGIESVIDGGKK